MRIQGIDDIGLERYSSKEQEDGERSRGAAAAPEGRFDANCGGDNGTD